ncbi:MAG: ATP-dependent DNA helicase RecG [Alphaproteobacteria bacterium]|nr:ATP-dependent DNA helicase RecG [Alphaproteobacteria bacterium]
MDVTRFINSDVNALKTGTPKIAQSLTKNVGQSLMDLALHLPTRVRCLISTDTLNPSLEGKTVMLNGIVEGHLPPRQHKSPHQIVFSIGAQKVFLTFFNGNPAMFARAFAPRKQLSISGTLRWKEQWQIAHPTIITHPAKGKVICQPLYPIPESIHPQRYRSLIDELLAILPGVTEWIPMHILQTKNWPSWKEALIQAHRPKGEKDLLPNTVARSRLAFDELLAHNLSIGLLTYHQKEHRAAKPCPHKESFFQDYADALPFSMTPCQLEACKTIYEDMLQPRPMLRLLQGDVGSGKTAVGLFAILFAAQGNFQAALLSPTEILAQQQAQVIRPIAEKLGKTCRILTSQTPKKERKDIVSLLAQGELDILIGTHAVLEKDVVFKNLNTVVIDEQHRFGVQQRLSIVDKGLAPHTLIMSATPIPRSLTLTLFGSVQVSRLITRPKPFRVKTSVTQKTNIEKVYASIKAIVAKNERVFWVCPLIEETEKTHLTPASQRFEDVQKALPDLRIDLLHGRMSGAEKNQKITGFRNGEIDLLVTTTVVEVGVDIPQCNLMIIENAEVFGLAQIHQLRGRVGRKGEDALCVLLYQGPLSESAQKRLATIRNETDGFKIAEEDLKLRGAGDVLGIKQSGLPPFKVADLIEHSDLYREAQQIAQNIVTKNPFLEGPKGESIRTLLLLLKNDSLSYIMSG